jgi:DtxR family Mn-dependent transcriptional regulator
MGKLSSSLEDYLECIYNQVTLTGSVKAIDISKSLSVSRASVTEALNKLAQKQYIRYGRYESISITNIGIKKAQEIINKHNIIQNFFEKVLDIDKTESTEIACKIEHVISENILNKLSDLTDFCSENKEFLKKFKKK